MRRRLFTFLSALSLLLCVASVALWVRSYRAADCFGWAYRDGTGGHVSVGIVSTMGAFSLGSEHVYHSVDLLGFYWNSPSPALPLTYSPGWRTFGLESESDSYSSVNGVMMPDWFAHDPRCNATRRPASRAWPQMASSPFRPLRLLRLRPPRHPRPLPGVRGGSERHRCLVIWPAAGAASKTPPR